ncbi:hypothetical protein ACQ4PT_071500 [Festuca glaucescens]
MAAPNPFGGEPPTLSFAGSSDRVGLSFPGGGDPVGLSFPGGGDRVGLSFLDGSDPADISFHGGGTDPAGFSFHVGGEFDSSSGGTYFTDDTPSLEHRVAPALAPAIITSLMKSSHRWASSLGGVEFHFPGEDNLERTLGRSDITVLNLLALVGGHGYGIGDLMYYVREKGKGKKGMEVIDSMSKVEKMLHLYDNGKVVNISVMKQKAQCPVGLNRDEMDGPFELEEPVVLCVDSACVSFYSQEADNVSDLFPMEIYYFEYRPEKRAAEREKEIAAELELMRELRKQKKQKSESPENVAILEKLRQKKQEREDPFLHFEGDTDVEEIYEPKDESKEEYNVETDNFEKKVEVKPSGWTNF